jgi:uncharacterized protein YggE
MIHVSALCLVTSLLVTSTAAAQPASPENEPSVVTVGRATVRTAPDRAFVIVATESTAPAPGTAQQQIARQMTAVRDALKSARVPEDAIKTLAYSLQEDVDFQNGKRVRRGYRAVNSIEVRVDDIGRVGEVIDTAVKAGANTVSDIRFDLKDRDAVERDALKKAVADARARAEAIASGAGLTIVRILRIDEQGQVVPVPRPQMMAMRGAVADAPETPITPGEIEVQASVTLTAAVK